MSVAFDARMTGGNGSSGNSQEISGAISISSTGMTVGASATCLIGMIVINASASVIGTVTMTWNGVSMTLGPSQLVGNELGVYIFSLVSPATGNKTLSASWSALSDAYMSCVSFSGTDLVTGVYSADNVTTSSGTSVTVVSSTTGATVAASIKDSGDPVMNQTAIWVDSPFNPGGGGSYAIGGTSNVHTFTYGGGSTQANAGVHVIAPVAAGALFGRSAIDGLSTSGPKQFTRLA